MRNRDIKTGCIYNVIFDPVQECEFNGKHLAVVLKKNNDGTTYIVMPLTSAANGEGINKYHLGKLSCLPASLRKNDTYAVYNQIRTVNCNRFIALKEGSNRVECRINEEVYHLLLELGMKELIYNISQNERLDILKKMYEDEKVIKAKDIAYIVKAKGDAMTKAERADKYKQIYHLIQGINYQLDDKYVGDGIELIFEQARNNSY